MTREIRFYLDDILESINLIEEYAKNLSLNEFEENLLVQDAVCRRFEVIGESVKNLPKSFRGKYPDIPWREIAGFRDVLTHAYFNVVVSRIWKVVKKDLPEFKKQIAKIHSDL